MLPAFTNKLVFKDHGNASFYGIGPWSVVQQIPYDGHPGTPALQIQGRNWRGEDTTLTIDFEFIDAMRLS